MIRVMESSWAHFNSSVEFFDSAGVVTKLGVCQPAIEIIKGVQWFDLNRRIKVLNGSVSFAQR